MVGVHHLRFFHYIVLFDFHFIIMHIVLIHSIIFIVLRVHIYGFIYICVQGYLLVPLSLGVLLSQCM